MAGCMELGAPPPAEADADARAAPPAPPSDEAREACAGGVGLGSECGPVSEESARDVPTPEEPVLDADKASVGACVLVFAARPIPPPPPPPPPSVLAAAVKGGPEAAAGAATSGGRGGDSGTVAAAGPEGYVRRRWRSRHALSTVLCRCS